MKATDIFRQISIIRHERKALSVLKTADLRLSKAVTLIEQIEGLSPADMMQYKDICAVSLCITQAVKVMKGVIGPGNLKEVHAFIKAFAETDGARGRIGG